MDMIELDYRIMDVNKKKMKDLYRNHRGILINAEWDGEYDRDQITRK